MKRLTRRLLSLLLITILLVPAAASAAPSRMLTTTSVSSGLTGYNAREIVGMMGLGFNIGNTFDSTGGTLASHETAWGNPKVTQQLIDAVYDAGFNTVRIPITWMDFISKDGTYTIDPAYLARIKEVVDYCYNDGLFVIINVHHESWVNRKDLDTAYPEVAEELNAVWAQIATYFANYDQHLLFEGMNEPRMAGTPTEWTGTDAAYAAVNYLNQVFVNAVRSTKLGHNDERCLMIPGYAASSSTTVLQSIAIPVFEEKPAENVIVSVHSYTPYEFCLTDQKTTFALIGSNTGSVDSVFRDLYTTFLQNNIPVIVGETGATNSGDNTSARADWAKYTAMKAASYGIPLILWDNGAGGSSGGECHRYINRKTGEILYPEIFDALKEGWNSVKRGVSAKPSLPRTGGILGGYILWENFDGCEVSPDAGSLCTLNPASAKLSAKGNLAVVFRGEGTPTITFPVDITRVFTPKSIASMSGYRIALFPLSEIAQVLADAGAAASGGEITVNMGAKDGAVTCCEICAQGVPSSKENPAFTYKVNGVRHASSADGTPKKPAADGMKFLGWYTSPFYAPGSEFSGTITEGTKTVYAKMALSSFKKVTVSLTPAELPVIEPRDTRPTPTVTPVPTEAVTVTPSPTPQESGTSVTPTAAPVPENEPIEYDHTLVYLMLVLSLMMIGTGIYLVVRGILRRRKGN